MYRNYDAAEQVDFSVLKGKVLLAINGKVGDESMEFATASGETYRLVYYEDCCARCNVEEIHGDLNDLLGNEILLAEEVESHDNPEGIKPEYQDSFTWTFYKLSTIKGSVTIRWYGESNGYYSETATFERVLKNA